MKNKMFALALLAASSLSSFAAATPPDVSGIVESGATVAYAAIAVAILITTAIVAIRSVRKFVK